MKAAAWQKRIKEQAETIGTYKPSFDSVIADLARILEQRDAAYKQFVDEGRKLMVTKTSDRGAENIVQNPLITLWDKLNSTALSYWRDLGLTPKGLKAIDESALKPKKATGMDELVKAMSGLDG